MEMQAYQFIFSSVYLSMTGAQSEMSYAAASLRHTVPN
jgi:hypothetical protein